MPRVNRSVVPVVVPKTPAASPPPASRPAAPADTFSAGASAGVPAPSGGLRLEPRPPPEVEVPGVGLLSQEQAEQVLRAAQTAVSQALSYGRLTGASVPEETLKAASDIGAVKALRELGYVPASSSFADVRAELGPLLDWARSPYTLKV